MAVTALPWLLSQAAASLLLHGHIRAGNSCQYLLGEHFPEHGGPVGLPGLSCLHLAQQITIFGWKLPSWGEFVEHGVPQMSAPPRGCVGASALGIISDVS